MTGLSDIDTLRINYYRSQIRVLERAILLFAALFVICAAWSIFGTLPFWVSLVLLVMAGLCYLGAEHYYRKIEEVLFYERD